jgi:hypothetical protein
MRRRRPRLPEGPPLSLLEFLANDWPGRTVADRFAFWSDARRQWRDEHGWPGDAIDFIRGRFQHRRLAFGLPASPQAVPREGRRR